MNLSVRELVVARDEFGSEHAWEAFNHLNN